jgi:uncharacterized membrane protein
MLVYSTRMLQSFTTIVCIELRHNIRSHVGLDNVLIIIFKNLTVY